MIGQRVLKSYIKVNKTKGTGVYQKASRTNHKRSQNVIFLVSHNIVIKARSFLSACMNSRWWWVTSYDKLFLVKVTYLSVVQGYILRVVLYFSPTGLISSVRHTIQNRAENCAFESKLLTKKVQRTTIRVVATVVPVSMVPSFLLWDCKS